MKYKVIIFIWFYAIAQSYGQNYDLDLNLPEIPSSPAFILMGVSPTEIQSPQTVSDLTFSAQNATNDFTSIPKNYFLSLSPYWLITNKYIPYSDFSKGKGKAIGQNIIQTLQISVGFADSSTNNLLNNRIGLGVNFSLIRGDVDSVIEADYFLKLREYNSTKQQLVNMAELSDEELTILRQKQLEVATRINNLSDANKEEMDNLTNELNEIGQAINQRQVQIEKSIESEYLDEVKAKLKKTKFVREGFFCDVAGGLSWDQYSNDLTKLYRGGLWVNPGFQSNRTNWVGILRLLSHDEVISTNESGIIDTSNFTSFDFGLKLEYNVGSIATLSGEAIYRSIPNTEIEDTYRTVINLGYNLSKDILLNFTYGKDFDVLLTGDSQNLALFNLVMNVGQKRKINI